VSSVVIWTIALLIVLGELGVDLAPLIAGTAIVGVALGFGAQTIVRDFLAGLFVVLEDQYGVGDVIDAGAAFGTVEWVSLRLTRLRDSEGVIWHVPNGEIKRVGNLSQRRDVGGGEPPGDDDPAENDPAGDGGPDVDPGESGAGPPSDRL
jgi:small conductance mechanosensitive channel